MRSLYSKIFIVAMLLILPEGRAQQTITLQPDAAHGKDAMIEERSSVPVLADNNYADFQTLEANAWTWSGVPGFMRGLLEFDLSVLPAGATIVDAQLSLFNNPTAAESNGEHHSLTGSNEAVLRRITDPWDEHTVTWNNQPAVTNQNEVILPQSTSLHQDYLNIDVTTIITDMLNNPATSFGFLLQLQTEQYYRCMIFATSDHPNCNLHPKLVITYNAPDPFTTLILQPDDVDGIDAMIQQRNGDPTLADLNYGTFGSIQSNAWTWSGDPGLMRGLFVFDFSSIPSTATVINARLSLYNDSAALENNGEHSSLSGSNESLLQRITSSWSESTVTWNTQPTTTTQNEVTLTQSTSVFEDYIDVDVTLLVRDMVTQGSNSFGFMLKLANEQHYRDMIFASSDNPNCNLHPRLQLSYSINTSINELPGSSFSIFPNPGSGVFSITFNSSKTDFQKMQIINDLGQAVCEKAISQSAEKIIRFDLSNSAKGIYFIILSGKDVRSTNKFILE